MNATPLDATQVALVKCYRLARERTAQVQADKPTDDDTARLGRALTLLIEGGRQVCDVAPQTGTLESAE